MKFSGINLLDEMARPELAELRAVFRERTFAKNTVIYTPNEAQDLVFVIAEGRVRVYISYEDKEFTLGILNPGDLYATHAGCHIQALDDTTLLVAGVREVKRVMAEVPAFTRTMVRVLGHILQTSFDIIGGLVFKDIHNRLVDYLVLEGTSRGERTGEGTLIDLNLTIEQLAQLLGATRQTVSTLLGELARAGLLEKRGRGSYRIPDLDALARATEK
jgi:CRP-like cAMP-binding protein